MNRLPNGLLLGFLLCGLLPVASVRALQDPPTSEAKQDSSAKSKQDPKPKSAAFLDKLELAIFRSERYRRTFVESYLSDVEVEPGVTLDERETMEEILGLIREEKLADALELAEANRSDTATPIFDFTIGNLYVQLDEQYEKAIAAYRIACLRYPKFRRARQMLGQAAYRLGEYDEAVSSFAKVVAQGGGDEASYGMLALSQLKRGEYIAAEMAFKHAIMLSEKPKDWKIGLAQTYFRQRRFQDAIALFDAMLAKDPQNTMLWIEQGKAFAELKDFDRAAQNFEMVDKLGAASADSLLNLGNIYANRGMSDLAAGYFIRGLEMEPVSSRDRVAAAAGYMSQSGAIPAASRLLNALDKHKSDDVSKEELQKLLRLKAQIALMGDDAEEEAKVLLRLTELDPADGDSWIALGRHASRGGDYERAGLYFERAANLAEFEAEAKLRHGEMLATKKQDYAGAIPLIERSQFLRPKAYVQKFLEDIKAYANRR